MPPKRETINVVVEKTTLTPKHIVQLPRREEKIFHTAGGSKVTVTTTAKVTANPNKKTHRVYTQEEKDDKSAAIRFITQEAKKYYERSGSIIGSFAACRDKAVADYKKLYPKKERSPSEKKALQVQKENAEKALVKATEKVQKLGNVKSSAIKKKISKGKTSIEEEDQ